MTDKQLYDKHAISGWSLRFERDGTEDVAIIYDADGDELLRSRHFWLPDRDDPVPPTLAAIRLAYAAPRLLAALDTVLPYAESECLSLFECWRRDDDPATKQEADKCEAAIIQAVAAIAQAKTIGVEAQEPDIHGLLVAGRQIALIWSIEDVQEIRPDLSEDQAWQVLQEVDRHKDAELGISWMTLEMVAQHLFGDASETDEAEEA